MPYLYLVLSVLFVSTTSIFGKLFNRKNDGRKSTSAFYNFFLHLSVFVCWGALFLTDISFEPSVLWYSLAFAVCYAACNIGVINALRYGLTTLTSLFVGLSLILTTIWGFFFWNAPFTIYVATGLVAVVVAIVLCLYTKEKEKKAFSWKWLFFVSLAFFGNAGCSIVQRTQQINYGGKHGYMLMLFATGIAAAVFFFVYLKSDREDAPAMLKTSWWIPVLAGGCNVALNVFVMLLANTELSPSLVYPVIGVGELALVTVFSLVAFRERMRWWQWVGIAIGAVAIVLLSI